MSNVPEKPVSLQRDCRAVSIPAGDTVTLLKGTVVTIAQMLGGSITVTAPTGLFRIEGEDAPALGLAAPAHETPANEEPVTESRIWNTLETCFDPEIPVNIVDLGLVYDLRISDGPSGGKRVDVKMTLTAPGCGMGPSIAADAQRKLLSLPGVTEANVDVVWDPRWNPTMISPEGRKKLGIQ